MECVSDVNEEASDSTYISDTDNDILDINSISLTKKETYYYRIIDKYHKSLDPKKVQNMIDIINGKSKISLRLLDWFVTRYANKYKIRFENDNVIADDDDKTKKVDNGFNVHISYKAQLKSYKKRYFDPFRRRKKFRYFFDKEKKITLVTTIGQLNFFRWAFTNDVVDYVAANYDHISKAMIAANKIDKARKLTEKTKLDDTESVETKNSKSSKQPQSPRHVIVRTEKTVTLSFD